MKKRNIAELKIKHLRNLPKRCLKRQGGSLSMKKLSTIIAKIGGCTEIQKVLTLRHLCQLFRGTSVKLSKSSVNMLRMVEPFTARGRRKTKVADFVEGGDGDSREDQVSSLLRRL
ncbi:hypothetical protein GH733_009735, partial [Mirounga leonina]